MKLHQYNVELSEDRIPFLVSEKVFETKTETANNAEKVVGLFNTYFHADALAEEHIFMVAFDVKMRPLGVFVVAHGQVSACAISLREIYQRALLAGAHGIILLHNHPSGDVTPSKEDDRIAKTLLSASSLMGVVLQDFIIIGNGYFSYKNEGHILS